LNTVKGIASSIGISAVGGCAAGKVSGGSCTEGAKLAVIAQGLKVMMDFASGYKSSWKTSKGDAVIKTKGDGVENDLVDNTGTSVEVNAGSEAEVLAGRSVLSLSESDLKILQRSLANKDTDFFSWSSELNKVVFDKSNFNYWISEYSPVMSGLSQNIYGVRAFSVFHDRWMATWDINNLGILIGTIPPAAAAQYYALGVGNYHYYQSNLEED